MQSLFRDDLLLWCQEGDCALQRDVIFTGTPEGVGAVEAARFRAKSTLPRQHRPAALGAWALWLVLASKPGVIRLSSKSTVTTSPSRSDCANEMTPFGDNVTYVYLNGSTWSQAWRDQLSLLLPHDLLHEMLFAFHRQAIIALPSSECVWQSCIRRKVSLSS
ncbi:hypothetical protein QF001_006794 [Paraburkholderia youngii]|uniref:hypothetical protein n=1 Tax=Paraburkholderia youngii TaxID=2782701 RepID=UPI003D19DD50